MRSKLVEVLRTALRADRVPARHRPLVLVQATLAPLHVPIIFGRKWSPAISALTSAYLSAIPSPCFNASSRALQAVDKHNWVRWIFLFAIYFAIAFPAGASWNFTGAALAILIAHVTAPSIHALWAREYISKSMQSKAVGQHG